MMYKKTVLQLFEGQKTTKYYRQELSNRVMLNRPESKQKQR